MLFIPETELESRERLLDKIDAGKISPGQAYRSLLEADPFDEPVLLAMASLSQRERDLEAAENYAWRAVEAQPCLWEPWLELAQLIALRGDTAMSEALAEIGARRLKLDTASLYELESLPEPLAADETTELPLQVDALIAKLGLLRAEEPPEVTSLLRLHRLLLELQESQGIEREMVDAIVREGEATVPLLVGFLRGYAREGLFGGGEGVIENVLALLGEIGSPLVLAEILECSGIENAGLSGAAGWAFDRIVELQPEAAGQALLAMAPKLDGEMRLLLAERFIFWPRWNVVDRLFDLLAENIEIVPRAQRGEFFSALAIAIIVARRREGVQLAKRMLRRSASLMDRDARRECDEKIELFSENGGNLLQTIGEAKHAEWTVYQICAGEALWPEDVHDEDPDELEEDGDDALLDDELPDDEEPIPVQRPPAPGRNEPCWCGSGKKYKKCHLDADNTRP